MKLTLPITFLSLLTSSWALPLEVSERTQETALQLGSAEHLAVTAKGESELLQRSQDTALEVGSAEHLAATATLFQAADVVTTENGLTTDACKPVILIFARGTFEDGNVGARIGEPLATELRSRLGTSKVTVQGVDYPADVLGYLDGGDNDGAETMASLINSASSKCPSAKLVLGGYSQGAQLVHKASKTLSAAVTAKVAAVVVFGDPDNGQAVGSVSSSEVDNFCHDEDIICSGWGGFTTHLTYIQDAPAAATFIVSAVGSV